MNFNPIEATLEQSERLRRIALQWTLEEEAEEFRQLPGEPLGEFLEAREAHLRNIELFGPLFPPKTSEAWEIVQGLRRTMPKREPRQLELPFDEE